MRVLILHASLGSGHVSASAAIESALTKRGAEVRTEDSLEYTNAALRTLVKTIITKFSQESPALYRKLYEGTDTPDPEAAMRDNELYGRLQAPMYRSLVELIEDYKPDRIICAQQLPALVVHALAAQGTVKVPWYIVITDYMAHSSWILSDVDGYFVAWEGVAEVLESWGVPADTITVSGIPVRPEIEAPKSPEKMRLKHGIGSDGPVVLAIASGIDVDRFGTVIEQLAARLDTGAIVVVAGRNDEIQQKLAELEPQGVELHRLGFVDYMDDLVAASDLVISKSGGLITTEVLARGVPLVVLDPFPGQEEWNADYISGTGAGTQVRVPGMIAPTVAHLWSQPDRLDVMRSRAKTAARPDAAQLIADVVLSD
ncbi:MAG: MGDG synthase family glycosyltransferase [Acidimicrobiia bacterium]